MISWHLSGTLLTHALAVARGVLKLCLGDCQGRSRKAPWRWPMVLRNCALAVATDAPEWRSGGTKLFPRLVRWQWPGPLLTSA